MLPKSHSVSHTTFSLPTAWVHRSSSWVSTHGLVLSLAFLVLGLPARPGPFFSTFYKANHLSKKWILSPVGTATGYRIAETTCSFVQWSLHSIRNPKVWDWPCICTCFCWESQSIPILDGAEGVSSASWRNHRNCMNCKQCGQDLRTLWWRNRLPSTKQYHMEMSETIHVRS